MTPSAFRPFETHLDLEDTTKLVRTALNGAEDGELFLERSRSESLVLDDGRVKTASYDLVRGIRPACGAR